MKITGSDDKYMDRVKNILKSANVPLLITSDENVFYYSSFTGGDSFLLIHENFRGIFTDTRYTLQAREETEGFEIFDNDAIGSLKKVVTDLGIETVGIEEENLTVSSMAKFTSFLKFIPVGKIISEQRAVKDEEEIKKIRESQKLSQEAFDYFLENAYIGMSEVCAASLIESYMRKNGAKKTSFDTIIASGKRGAMPHGIASKEKINEGSLVVCDFGCVLDNYCSDMTRTIAFGEVSQHEKDVYSVVLRANIEACSKIKSGMTGSQADKIARDIIEKEGYGEFFNHSLGHGVGLQIHESPYASKKSDIVLKENMTLTIEPGVYIPEKFGIRIEDLVVIKNDGILNLTETTKQLISI